MTREALMDTLVEYLKEYAPTANESVLRNSHMNELGTGTEIPQDHIDAVLVDFVNFVGFKQGIDLALYTEDLKK